MVRCKYFLSEAEVVKINFRDILFKKIVFAKYRLTLCIYIILSFSLSLSFYPSLSLPLCLSLSVSLCLSLCLSLSSLSLFVSLSHTYTNRLCHL